MKNPDTAPDFSRAQIAQEIIARLDPHTIKTAADMFSSSGKTQWFYVDNLLPAAIAEAIYIAFPSSDQMRERKTIREHKYVAAQMDLFDPQAEEALFAFHDTRVVELISKITNLPNLVPDPELYAGGISLMARGNFLNPHLDNSHNKDKSIYRVLNLLYYCSPGWDLQSGGHLEIWPKGLKQVPLTIPNIFNRLVVMSTGLESWHSVSKVERDSPRCCVSNYYFSPDPIGDEPYFRVTSFRGRPEQPLRDLFLRADGTLRHVLRKILPKKIAATTHLYKKAKNNSKI